jgi:4'-phosphopantetheinyl transferase
VHIWRAQLDQPSSRVQALAQTLSPDERERADRFYFERDTLRFLVCRGVLRTLLGWYLGIEPDQIRFIYSERGKPALAGGQASSRICFNLSHSRQVAVYAFHRGWPVGVDVEYMRDLTDAGQIAERYFSTAESFALRGLAPDERKQGFYNCWTRKEAFIKAVGDGLAYPLDAFQVSLAPGAPARLESLRSDPAAAHRWHMEAFTPAAGYAAAWVVEGTQPIPVYYNTIAWNEQEPDDGN